MKTFWKSLCGVPSQLLRVCLLWCAVTAGASAQSVWPAYIAQLRTETSDSPVRASLPVDTRITAPSSALDTDRARWSGIWRGWACAAKSCDIALAVSEIDSDGASVIFSQASELRTSVERGRANFVGGELRLVLSGGGSLVFRLRQADEMEMISLGPDSRLRAAGVLTSRPLAPSYRRSVETVATPWTEKSQAVSLVMLRYWPAEGTGPWPTVVINHGSTGNGDRPELFGRASVYLELARYFTQRGWQVLFPQRRGRGGSGGVYDEGFTPDRSRYGCNSKEALQGLDHALADLEVVMQQVQVRPDVDPQRLMLAGVSRGGLLSLAYAGLHPQVVAGVINFVGGWVGEACPDSALIHQAAFRKAAPFPRATLWLYAEGDSFYSLTHSRTNFETFTQAGGKGRLAIYESLGAADGHDIAERPDLWSRDLDEYLKASSGN